MKTINDATCKTLHVNEGQHIEAQYTAADMASQAAQGFRDGQAAMTTSKPEQQTAPDVSALVEALEVMLEMVELGGFGKAYAMDIARAALAAHRKQGE